MTAKGKNAKPAKARKKARSLPTPRFSVWERLRNYLITGIIVIAPSVIAIWTLVVVVRWFDDLLRPWLRGTALNALDVPGIGVVLTFLLLMIVGWMASWFGARWLLSWWDRLLTRIPGIGILYGSAKSLGEAIFTDKRQAFRQVVLLEWPNPGVWRIGFVTGQPGEALQEELHEEHEVVFVPHTPNPASGFVHYVPRSRLRYLDWAVEDGLKMIMSGGVVQPGTEKPDDAKS